jgi:hypothetical protein
MKFVIRLVCVATLLFTSAEGGAWAQAVSAKVPAQIVDLPRVAVGVKSPPMWLFSKGGKKLVVLGTQLPLPKSGVLVTESIRDYIGKSDAVLTGPGLNAGDSVGFLQGLTLIASMRKAQRNADGRSLSEVVPPDVYSRWKVLKAKYMGNNRGVEELRPMYAAYELYEAALKHHALTDTATLGGIIAKATKDAGLKRVDARYALPVENLRKTVKAFEVPAVEDLQCFTSTIDGLEAYLEYSPIAADAWSVGDVERYRLVESQYRPIPACWAQLTNEAIGRSVGVPAPYAIVDAVWLSAVHSALASHDVVFTTMPARDLIQGTGLAARLRADGFAVTELFAKQATP